MSFSPSFSIYSSLSFSVLSRVYDDFFAATKSFWFECSGRNLVVRAFDSVNCNATQEGTNATVLVSPRDTNRCEFQTIGDYSLFINACGENDCFHEDTRISYKGKELSMDDLRQGKEPECSVPHVVSSRGLTVNADCQGQRKSLRVTDGHLIFTQRGAQPARDISEKDVVYADMAEKVACKVISVEKEATYANYFGLNCHNSALLASGIKSSTFEKLHSVPSFWMSGMYITFYVVHSITCLFFFSLVMGKVLGIKRASAVGDYVSALVDSMQLL